MKAHAAQEAHNESESHPSAARAKAAAGSESGRRYRNVAGHGSGLDREKVVERGVVKVTEREMEVGAGSVGTPAFQSSSFSPTVSSCGTNGDTDVEALLAKLRAL